MRKETRGGGSTQARYKREHGSDAKSEVAGHERQGDGVRGQEKWCEETWKEKNWVADRSLAGGTGCC